MKLRGNWSNVVTYNVGDIVRYTNGDVCILHKPCKAGVPPLETTFWGRADDMTTEIVNIALDAVDLAGAVSDGKLDKSKVYNGLDKTGSGYALDARQGKALKELIPTNITGTTITLKDSSDNEYTITVDASGDTPALAVTAVTPAAT